MNTETQLTDNVVDLKTETNAAPVVDVVVATTTPRRGRPPKSLSSAKTTQTGEPKKSTAKGHRIKEPVKKVKKSAGVKAQTQVPKTAGAFIKRYAKENSTKETPIRAADVTRKALLIGLKRLGYVDSEA